MNTTSHFRKSSTEGTPRVIAWLLVFSWALAFDAVALPPPVITSQPISQTVKVSGAATFVVQAASATPLSYQWFFQSNAIPGATANFYTRTNVQQTNAGAYYVRVSNADGTVNSSNAFLVVNDAPSLSGANNLSAVVQNENNRGTEVSVLINGKVTDPNSGALRGIAVVAVDNLNGTWEFTTNDGTSWSPFGNPTAGAARLLSQDGNSRVRFVPNTNFFGTVTNGLTFRAWDQTRGTNGSTAHTVHTTNTVLDQFSAVSYGNNDGTQPWSGDWVETGSSGPGSGNIKIVSGVLQILNAVAGDAIYREANLSGTLSPTLSLWYTTDIPDGAIILQGSSNGGGSYVRVPVFSTNVIGNIVTVDLSTFAAANTRLRFLVEDDAGAVRQLNIDDFQIKYTNPGNGGATAYSSDIAAASVTVVPVADVVTTLSGPSSVPALSNFTYTVTVSNRGPSAASGVAVSATLSSNLTFIGASAGGAYLAGGVTWAAIPSLASGAATNFTVTVRSPSKGNMQSVAASTATTLDPDAANNDGGKPAAKVATTISPLQIGNTSSGASVSTLNWSHTVSPGSARILIVGVSIDNPNTAVNAATFANFLPLTLIGQTSGTQTKVAMYSLLNPPVGTFPISISLNATEGIVGGAVSLNGVNQANPISAFAVNSGTSGEASVTVTSSLGGLVIDTVAPKSSARAISPGTQQTVVWNRSSSDYSGAGGTTPGAVSVNPSWTLNGGSPAWVMAAVALDPAILLADVTLAVTGPSNVMTGSNLTYTITVTNLGSDLATNLVVSDAVPAGATFVSASSGGTFSNGVVTWPVVSSLASGARTNYTVTIAAPGDGPLTNIAYSSAVTADPDPSNNNGTGNGNQVITTVTPRADVATTVSGPNSVLPGSTFDYTVTVTNAGASSANEIIVSDTLPWGATFVSASHGGSYSDGVVTWLLPALPRGATSNFLLTVTAPAEGILTNTISSTSSTTDPLSLNNDGSAPSAQLVTMIVPIADVVTEVSGPPIAITNAAFNYIVTVANLGPSLASGVMVSNTLPAGAVFISASAGGILNGNVVTWSVGNLASGATTNLVVSVIAPFVGSLTNTVASSAVTTDPNVSNNNGTMVTARISTSVYPLFLLAGQQLPAGFQIEFHTHPETSFSIQASTNLTDWATLLTTNSGNGHVIFVDEEAANHPHRFYRTRQGQ